MVGIERIVGMGNKRNNGNKGVEGIMGMGNRRDNGKGE